MQVVIQELQRSLRQRRDFALAVKVFVVLRAGLRRRCVRLLARFGVGEMGDERDEIVRRANALVQGGVARLEESLQRPDGDVLKGRVVGFEKAVKVAVQTARRLAPDVDEGRVVVGCSRMSSTFSSERKSAPFEDRFPIAAALLPRTSRDCASSARCGDTR